MGTLRNCVHYIKIYSVLVRTKITTFALIINLFIHMRYNMKLIVIKVQYSFEQNHTNARICKILMVIRALLRVI
jgi:hypothetical protein